MTNKKLIEKINEEFSKGNNEFYLDYLTDDIRWNIVGMPTIYGKRNFLKAIQTLELENFPVMTVKNIIAEGDYVVVESIGTASKRRPYSPFRQGMALPRLTYCDVYLFKGGKILELTTYVVDTTLIE